MALSVALNLNLIDAAEATTGWSFSGITKTATATNSREGTNCVGGQVPVSSFGYAWHTHGSSINMTTAGNERVYIWVNSIGAGTFAQSGWMVLIGDGTNRRAYRVGGSDDVPFAVKGWYCLMLDTANLPTTYQTVAGASQPTLTAITQFGFGIYNTVAPSGNALNVFVDVVRYGSGIIVTSGATDDISLADIAADDFSGATGKAYGIIREIQPGVYGIQGDVLFGDTGGSSIDWKESDAVVIFEDRVRGASTNTNFQFSGQHSATGTFRVELGIAVSSGDDESGRSGVIFFSANPANQPIDFDFSDSDIEDVFLYGCSLTNLRGGTIAFSADATNGISHHLSGTGFSGCAQVDLGVTVARNCLFASTADTSGALLWNDSINIKNSNFIGNTTGPAVEHPDWNGSEDGTVTSADPGTTLFDGAATFIGNVAADDIVYNEADNSFGTVTSVEDDDEISHTALAGGSDNKWDISDAYSIATPYVYTNLEFSGNTYDVDNTVAGDNVVAISKIGTSNPSTFPTGDHVAIQGAVDLTITVKDKNTLAVISGVQTSIHTNDASFTQLMNEDTNGSGIATAVYTAATPQEIVWRCRKSDDLDNPRYKAASGIDSITSDGFSLTVLLEENPVLN